VPILRNRYDMNEPQISLQIRSWSVLGKFSKPAHSGPQREVA